MLFLHRFMAALGLPALVLSALFAADAPQRHAKVAANANWMATVEARLAHQEYFVSSLQAPNRAQDLRTYYTAHGLRVVPRLPAEHPWEWDVSLAKYGSAGDLLTPSAAKPFSHDNRVDYRRGTLDEWYVNDEHGLEQGFTLSSPPSGSGPLVFQLAIGGTLRAQETRSAIDLVDGNGSPVLHYADLRAQDARGHALASRFAPAPDDHTIRIEVNATHARYPITVDPLATSASWIKESNFAMGELGISVATAGDVNGDGISDLIVGALHYDTGNPNAGQVTVYYGTPTGPSLTPAWTASDAGGGDLFGSVVATAGDVNADGYADILIAAPHFSGRRGIVCAYYGSASGLGPNGTIFNADWVFVGPDSSDDFGASIACAGDIDGDGYSDIVIGAPDKNIGGNIFPGKAFVFLGSKTGLHSTGYKEIVGNGDQGVGTSVATAGDVNGDGYSDIVIGAPRNSVPFTQQGMALVYYGPDLSKFTSLLGGTNSNFGWSVSTAGDVDGDGYADIVVGAPRANSQAGAVEVFRGSSNGITVNPTWTYTGVAGSDFLGFSVATAGDVNGDGYADVIAGWYGYSVTASSEGAAVLWYGSSTGLKASGTATNADWLVHSGKSGSALGYSVATAGDVNGDGLSDVIVGAPFYTDPESQEGAAFLYLGQTNLLNGVAWQADGSQANATFGFAVAGGGDFNADGYSDVAVAAPNFDNGVGQVGRVQAFYGSPTGVSTFASWQLTGGQFNERLGASIANAGDVNGDGYDDLIVGAPGYTPVKSGADGAAFVFQGGLTGLPGALSATVSNAAWFASSNQSSSQFGASVASAGDVNGDGFSDVIVGAPNYAGSGAAFLWLGSATGLGASGRSADWSAAGTGKVGQFGNSVASAGDVNADGYSDVIIGAPGESSAFAWYGSATGLGANGTEANADWARSGAVSSQFGHAVGTAGDMNGDGYSDITVGAPVMNSGGGEGFVYLGSAAGLLTSPWLSISGTSPHQLGSYVGTAGDMDGDGFSDVFFSEPTYSNGQINEGAILLYFGGAFGPHAILTIEANADSATMGPAVCAGDVNGDGYADLLVGLPERANFSGSARLYYGGRGAARSLDMTQLRVFSNKTISRLMRSDSDREFRITHNSFSPFGRGRLRPEYEVKPVGQKLNGTAIVRPYPGYYDLAHWPPSLSQTEDIQSLTVNTAYHWRMRFHYDTSQQPFLPACKWFSPPSHGPNETDLRTAPTVVTSAEPTLTGVQLAAATPNPFLGETTFRFSLPTAMAVRLSIFDARGRLVRDLLSGSETAGWHAITWDGLGNDRRRISEGSYFARMDTPEGERVERVVLSR